MAMKQTQTKLFDFSDVGLDFCAGSKNLFPDRFKRMLVLGYNLQTVTSVSVAGNQVTFNYGVSHGYVADRVLKVSSGPLAAINNGEFVIDSVTATSLTMTIDTAPISIAGGFTTIIASLGWDLVYEQNHIHIYKFKHIDDTDMFARLCFQNATAAGNRNCVAVGIGRSIDLGLGHITDTFCPIDLATCATVHDATSNLRWDFTNSTAATFNNYTYTQGLSTFGQARVVGSKYHLAICYFISSSGGANAYISGIFPFANIGYEAINFPVLLCQNNGVPTSSASNSQLSSGRLYAGNIRLKAQGSQSYIFPYNIATANFLSNYLDSFNTTTCSPILMVEQETGQTLGCVYGIYQAMYANSDQGQSMSKFPSLVTDIDFQNKHLMHLMQYSASAYAYLVFPVEEIKIGY